MSDEEKRKESPEPAKRRETNWDAVAAIVAALVGLLAIFVSAYTAWNSHQQTRAAVWPHVMLAWSGRDHGLVALNRGVGPAIMRSVVVRVDGTPQPDWNHVMKALGFADDEVDFAQSDLNGMVLLPRGSWPILLFQDKSQYRNFQDVAEDRLAIRVCFCSILGDCWRSSLHRRPHAVDGCPKTPQAIQFEG